MSVEIKGTDELIQQLENKFGKKHMQSVSDDALKAGAEVFVKELKSQVSTFSGKGKGKGYSQGYTYDEITVSDPMWDNGERVIKVHWEGPNNRKNIIHLNEWGTVRNPSPPGKGKIAMALKNSERAYREAIEQALKEGL